MSRPQPLLMLRPLPPIEAHEREMVNDDEDDCAVFWRVFGLISLIAAPLWIGAVRWVLR